MGGCYSSVGNQPLPEQVLTNDTVEKDSKEQHVTDIISPRTINVQPADSDDDSHRSGDQRSVVTHHTPLELSSALPENQTDREKQKSTPKRYGDGSNSIHSANDGYRNEDLRKVDLNLQIQELRTERDEIWKLNMDLQKTVTQQNLEIDELRTRLSRVASERLTDNNPNIADLSDPNRPVKIAEMYMEVYNNEWSDALDDLMASDARTEKEAITILLHFTKVIYSTCIDVSNEQLNDMNARMLMFTGHIFKGETMQLPSRLSSALKPFKDERKRMYKEFLPSLCKETNKLRDLKLVKKADKTKRLQKYLDTVTELCWLMCIQEPPVHLYTDCKQGNAFDEINFTAFTVRGKTVDYLVWPALHLHENGPVLWKGVAQAKRK